MIYVRVYIAIILLLTLIDRFTSLRIRRIVVIKGTNL